jgi:hypothetical protein
MVLENFNETRIGGVMKKFAGKNYSYINSIQHQGTVIVMAAKEESGICSFFYKALDLSEYDATAPLDEDHWTEMRELKFPDDYRSLGFSLTNIVEEESLIPKTTKFTFFTDQAYVYFFWRSDYGTLRFCRYIFSTVDKSLQPAWETRYRRSEKTDFTNYKQDGFNSKNMDEEPFLEPVYDLIMIKPLSGTTVSVSVTEDLENQQEFLNIFSINQNKEIEIFSLLRGDDAIPVLTDKSPDHNGNILPDQTITFNGTLPSNSPAVSIYMQLEKVPFDDTPESDRKLMRAIRLLLAVPVAGTPSGKGNALVLDFAVSKNGSLSQLPSTPLTLSYTDYSSMPLLNTDSNGLTTYGAILNPVKTEEPVNLNNSNDGDLFLYCNDSSENSDGNFNYIVYSTEVARATYQLGTNNSEVNIYAFAVQTGTIMNNATIQLTPSATTTASTLVLESDPAEGETFTETWYGLPRNIVLFQKILNGEATDQLLSPQVGNGSEIFYDYSQKWRVLANSLVDTSSAVTGTSCMVQSIPVSVTVAQPLAWTLSDGSTSDFCNVILTLTAGSYALKETFNEVPKAGEEFIKVINGQSTGYDYTANSVAEYPLCKISCGSGEIWFISRSKDLAAGKISIETITSDTCMISLETDVTSSNEYFKDLPRTPDEIVNYINSNSQLFWCLNSEADNLVYSQRISCSANLPGGSKLAVSINYGSGSQGAAIAEQKQVVEPQLTRGNASHLFTFSTVTNEFNLSNVLVESTVSHTQDGVNCNWKSPVARSALIFDESAIEIDAQPNLNIEDSLSLEAWIAPQIFPEDYVRIINHASDSLPQSFALGLVRDKFGGSDQYGVYAAMRETAVSTVSFPLVRGQWYHIAFTYETGYSLEFNGVELVDCGNGDTLNTGMNMTLAAWVKASQSIAERRILVSKYGEKPSEQSYQIYLENDDLVFKFRTSLLKNPGTGEAYQEYQCSAKLTTFGEWTYVAGVVSFETKNVDEQVNTYLSAKLQVNDQSANLLGQPVEIENESLQINVSATDLTVGAVISNTPVAVSETFNISEVQLWRRALSENELNESWVERRIATELDDLVSYWKFDEGIGKQAGDSQNLNNALITSSRLWRFSRQGAIWNIYINGEPQTVIPADTTDFGGYTPTTYIGAEKYTSPVEQCYIGDLDEVIIWNRALRQEEIVDWMYSALSGEEKGLAAYWPLDSGSGATIKDMSNHGNNGTFPPLPPAKINTTFHFTDSTDMALGMVIINSEITGIDSSPINGKFRFQLSTQNTPTLTANWAEDLTLTIKIGDQAEQPLPKDTAVALPSIALISILIGVDNKTIESLNYKNTSPQPPRWTQDSVAPVGLDSPICHEIGGKEFAENITITKNPAVNEYSDTQVDNQGQYFGVLKRCHAYINPESEACLETGYKIGDFDMQYVGQIQTNPTILGYIEGPPPVPSENLTINDPKTDDYVGTSSVELVENNSESYTYTGKTSSYVDTSIDSKIGIYLGGQTSAGVGVEQEVLKLEAKAGLHLTSETSKGVLTETVNVSETDVLFSNKVDCCGFWETKKDYDGGAPRYWNPEIGQRYLPNNMGYALVKSGTADLYALRLPKTGAVFSYVIVPNKDLPKDFNIIMFPINPSYVKNGTLDGMVGLIPDPDYPSALIGESGSYFKPIEAYALKRKIEQEKEVIKTYFTQISVDPSNLTEADEDKIKTGISGALLRDWREKISKRSIANTYVWTAQGGMYKDEEEFIDIKTTSNGGVYSVNLQVGGYTEFELRAGGVGVDLQADFMFGQRWEGEAVTTEEYKNSFGLSVDVTAEGWLNQYNQETGEYEEFDCPGKVDTYRFFSFFLSPATENFSTFFEQVVDPNWLNNSNSANAVALLQAQSDQNKVWRVLHRVTFVSRVPQTFKATPDNSTPPAPQMPVNTAFNVWFIDFVNQNTGADKSRGNIERAVDTVLDTQLKDLNPYWAAFLDEAQQNPDGDAAKQLYDIRNSSKAYMIEYFDALKVPTSSV